MRFGIRGWRVTEAGELQSTNFDYMWAMGELTAEHLQPSSVLVKEKHAIDECQSQSCGFYSYSSIAAAEKSGYLDRPIVMGVVLLGGKVLSALVDSEKYQLEGEHYRYRSEKAMLVAICDEVIPPMIKTPAVPFCKPAVLTGTGRTWSKDLYPNVSRITRADLKAFAAIEMTDPGMFGVM